MDEKVKAVKKSTVPPTAPLKFAKLTLFPRSERSVMPIFGRFAYGVPETPISSRPIVFESAGLGYGQMGKF